MTNTHVNINGANVKLVENEITGFQEAPFTAKLISISDNVVGTTKKGKDYYIGTGEFINSDGEVVQRGFMVMEGNYQYGMKPGSSYLSKVIFTEGRNPLLVMSHLTGNGIRATNDDFGFSFENTDETETISDISNEAESYSDENAQVVDGVEVEEFE